MTVSDLIDELSKLDPKLKVWVQTDEMNELDLVVGDKVKVLLIG